MSGFNESQLASLLLPLLSLHSAFLCPLSLWGFNKKKKKEKKESSYLWEGSLFHIKCLKCPILSVAEGQCGGWLMGPAISQLGKEPEGIVTTPRRALTMCQCRSVACNKCTTLQGFERRGDCAYVGAESTGESSVPSAPSCYDSKTAVKI